MGGQEEQEEEEEEEMIRCLVFLCMLYVVNMFHLISHPNYSSITRALGDTNALWTTFSLI